MLGCMLGIRIVDVSLAASELKIILVGLGGGMLIYELCPL